MSSVCITSFTQSVTNSLAEEGVATFAKIAASDAFLKRMYEDNEMFIAELDGKIAGVIELKQGRHIAMLFVLPEKQNRGIGRKLFASALSHAKERTMTVNASLSSVPVYKKFGFECSAEISESEGLVYQPMAIALNHSMPTHAKATIDFSSDRSS